MEHNPSNQLFEEHFAAGDGHKFDLDFFDFIRHVELDAEDGVSKDDSDSSYSTIITHTFNVPKAPSNSRCSEEELEVEKQVMANNQQLTVQEFLLVDLSNSSPDQHLELGLNVSTGAKRQARDSDNLTDYKHTSLTQVVDSNTSQSSQPGTTVSEESDGLKLKHLLPILQCLSCPTQRLVASSMHTCQHGHQVCGPCYHGGVNECPICSMPIEGRNRVLEKVLKRLRRSFPKLFSEAKGKANYSFRPFECPNVSCQRIVASNAGMIHHFKYSHPSVSLSRISLHECHNFNVPYECLGDARSSVLKLLEVELEDENEDEDSERGPASVLCVLLGATLVSAHYHMVVVWCAALYQAEPSFSYCLETSTSTGGNLVVNGEVSSLHDSQRVNSVVNRTPCLLLTPEDFTNLCANNNDHMPATVSFHITHPL